MGADAGAGSGIDVDAGANVAIGDAHLHRQKRDKTIKNKFRDYFAYRMILFIICIALTTTSVAFMVQIGLNMERYTQEPQSVSYGYLNESVYFDMLLGTNSSVATMISNALFRADTDLQGLVNARAQINNIESDKDDSFSDVEASIYKKFSTQVQQELDLYYEDLTKLPGDIADQKNDLFATSSFMEGEFHLEDSSISLPFNRLKDSDALFAMGAKTYYDADSIENLEYEGLIMIPWNYQSVKELFESTYSKELTDYKAQLTENKKSYYQGMFDEAQKQLGQSGYQYFISTSNWAYTNIDKMQIALGAEPEGNGNGIAIEITNDAVKNDIAPSLETFTADNLAADRYTVNGHTEINPKIDFGESGFAYSIDLDDSEYAYSIAENDTEDNDIQYALVGMSASQYNFAQTNYAQIRDGVVMHSIMALVMILLAIIIAIYLILIAGVYRKQNTSTGLITEQRTFLIDKIPVEITLILVAAVILIAFGVTYTISMNRSSTSVEMLSTDNFMIGVIAFTAGASTLILHSILNIVRLVRAKMLRKKSLIAWVIGGIGHLIKNTFRGLGKFFNVLKSGFDGRAPWAKAIVLIVIFAFAVFISTALFVSVGVNMGYGGLFDFIIAAIPLIAVVTLGLYFAYRKVADYSKVKAAVEAIAKGNTSYVIDVKENDTSEFGKLSKDINDIADATSIAVNARLKNEKLRTELISNVSHDIKTPLTSIISYTDLLKRDGLGSERAPEYLDIIDRKSQRLKKLTEDLFEAAKASSGDMKVHVEKIDLCSLLSQELVEYGDFYKERNLSVILDAPQPPVYIAADNQLLYRAIDNALANIYKYALEGSRVYIDVTRGHAERHTYGSKNDARGRVHSGGVNNVAMGDMRGDSQSVTQDGTQSVTQGVAQQTRGNTTGIVAGDTVRLEIKNISKNKLNISADELMERFTRGDESRNTEGSGLGLAIASDLTRLMGGTFNISIDGDLFKIVIVLNAYEE
jgi:signal transduction histidine kinase